MSESVNAFTVYSSLELQINEFVSQLNRASRLLDSTLQNMSGAVTALDVPPVEIGTEAHTGAVQDIENAVTGVNFSPIEIDTEPNFSGVSELESAVSSINVTTITIPTETQPLDPVTVPAPDDRNFIQKIKETGKNIVNTFKSFPSEVAGKFSEMKTLATEKIKELPEKISEVIKSVPSKIGAGLKAIGTNISEAFKSGVESAKNALKELPEKASEALKDTGEKLKGIAEAVAKAGTVAVSAVSAGVVAFGKSAVETGANFDKSMSQVASTMGKTNDEIADLRDFAQEMGRTTAFSATESAEALNYMALAGYDAETSMKMLPNVLNLASAGGMELALASDMITDSQSALGLSLDETTQLVDKMASASANSNTSVSQLGDAILTVGGTAKKLKGGTTELATVLGILADNGIKGSEGGTALRNMLNSLISPTDDAVKMLESMGTSLYDEAGNMRSLNDVFIDLRKGMDGLATQAEKDQVLTTIFNARDLKSAEALIANVGDRFNELSSVIDSSAGSADKMAKTQLDNLAGQMTLFQSALEGAKIAVSDQLTPALKDFVKLGTDGLSAVTDAFSTGVKEGGLENGFDSAVTALQPYLDKLINKILSAIPEVVSIATKLTGIIGQAIVKNIPKLAQNAVLLIRQFTENIAKNAPLAIKSFSQVLVKVKGWLISNGKNLISAGMELVKSVSQGISENLPAMLKSVKEIMTFIMESISKNLPVLLDSGLKIIMTVGQGIIKSTPKLLKSSLKILTSLGEYLIKKVPVLVKKAPEIVKSLANALSDCGKEMITVADKLMTKFADSIGIGGQLKVLKNSVNEAFGNIRTSFDNMKISLRPLEDVFDRLKNKIFGTKTESGLLHQTIGLLCDIISETVIVIGKIVSSLMDFVTWMNNGSKEAETLKDIIESVAIAIGIMAGGTAIKALITQLPVLLTNIVSLTATLVANAAAWISAAAPVVALGAAIALVIYDIKMIIDNFDELKEFFPLVWADFKKFLSDTRASLDEFLEPFIEAWFIGWESIANFFSERADDLKTGWKLITDFFSEKVDDWKTGIQVIKDFFTGMKNHIKTIFDSVGRFISGLVDNWKSGVQSIKNGIDNFKDKIAEIPEKFNELINSAVSWGRDIIDNFIGGIKEKASDLWDEVKNIAQEIKNFWGFSEPEKGPLSNFHTFAPDMIALFTQGIKNNKKSIFSEVNDIAGNIKDTFSQKISLNSEISTDINSERLKFPDIPTVSENTYTVRSENVPDYRTEKPVIVENLNITLDSGFRISSDYESEKFINVIAERIQARLIRIARGTGGVML